MVKCLQFDNGGLPLYSNSKKLSIIRGTLSIGFCEMKKLNMQLMYSPGFETMFIVINGEPMPPSKTVTSGKISAIFLNLRPVMVIGRSVFQFCLNKSIK